VSDLKGYLDALKQQASDKDKEEIQKIETVVDQIKAGITEWRPAGPSSDQKRSFVLNYDELRNTISRSSLADVQREHLIIIADQLKPFSASGKNCKAALMLLTVTP